MTNASSPFAQWTVDSLEMYDVQGADSAAACIQDRFNSLVRSAFLAMGGGSDRVTAIKQVESSMQQTLCEFAQFGATDGDCQRKVARQLEHVFGEDWKTNPTSSAANGIFINRDASAWHLVQGPETEAAAVAVNDSFNRGAKVAFEALASGSPRHEVVAEFLESVEGKLLSYSSLGASDREPLETLHFEVESLFGADWNKKPTVARKATPR